MKTQPEPCQGNCDHSDLTDHYRSGYCDTPMCSGWAEQHCRRCGWFTSTCDCGCCDGVSRLSGKAMKSLQKRVWGGKVVNPNAR